MWSSSNGNGNGETTSAGSCNGPAGFARSHVLLHCPDASQSGGVGKKRPGEYPGPSGQPAVGETVSEVPGATRGGESGGGRDGREGKIGPLEWTSRLFGGQRRGRTVWYLFLFSSLYLVKGDSHPELGVG